MISQFFRHKFHIGIDMFKVQFESGTEVVQSIFAVGSYGDAIFRTFSIAKVQEAACPALQRQAVALVIPEAFLDI